MKFLKAILKASLLSGASAGLIACLPTQQANAQTMTACPATNTITAAQFGALGSCAGTPEVYGLTFYEMGLCQGNPMTSGTFDPSNCVATFESTGGEYHDIAGASVVLGADAGVRPADGTYDTAYVIFQNVFTLKGNYAITTDFAGNPGTTNFYSDGTNYSDGVQNVQIGATSQAVEFTDTLTTFDGGGGTCDPDWAEPQSNGTLNAYVTDGSLSVATSCTGATRIVGALVLNSPITIDSTVTGLQVDFSVTNNGMSVIGDNDQATAGPQPAFGSGPFSATFTILN